MCYGFSIFYFSIKTVSLIWPSPPNEGFLCSLTSINIDGRSATTTNYSVWPSKSAKYPNNIVYGNKTGGKRKERESGQMAGAAEKTLLVGDMGFPSPGKSLSFIL